MLYLPFPPSYTNKLAEPGAIEIVNQNRNKTEPYTELVDNALKHYNTEFRRNEDEELVLENYEIDVIETGELIHNAQIVVDISISHQQYKGKFLILFILGLKAKEIVK